MLEGNMGNGFIAKYAFSNLLCGIIRYSCRCLSYLDNSVCKVKEILICVLKSIFVSMDRYLQPKVFGLDEENSSNIDPVRRINYKNELRVQNLY